MSDAQVVEPLLNKSLKTGHDRTPRTDNITITDTGKTCFSLSYHKDVQCPESSSVIGAVMDEFI